MSATTHAPVAMRVDLPTFCLLSFLLECEFRALRRWRTVMSVSTHAPETIAEVLPSFLVPVGEV